MSDETTAEPLLASEPESAPASPGISDLGIVSSHAPVRLQPFLVAPTVAQQFNTIGLDLDPVGCVLLRDLLFAFDSSFVNPKVTPLLAELPGLRERHRNAKGLPPLSLFGHADPVGQDDYNKTLSGRRARAIYGLLIHDVAIWESLFNNPFGGDNWQANGATQTMRATTGLPPSASRRELIQAYMTAICPFQLQKSDFLGHGADAGGKADFQGCSEFNPLVILSTGENKSLSTTERNHENQSNRRVLIFLYPPGRTVNAGAWPCPRVNEGTADCRKRFFADAESRRAAGSTRRLFEQTGDTFACRFYDRMARISPCESPRPPVPPPNPAMVNPVIAFTGVEEPPAAAQANGLVPASAGAASLDRAAKLAVSRNVVVVKKPHTNPDRVRVTLKTDSAFDGTGTFTRSNPRIKIFTSASPSVEIRFNGKDNVFTGSQLTAGFDVLAEGFQASTAMDDVTLTLTLKGGSKPTGPPATAKMTCVEVELDVCKRRTAAAADPPVLTEAQKVNPGRTIHLQNARNQRDRAMLIVRRVKPAGFTGRLTLTSSSPAVQIFRTEDPTTAGQTALANPFEIDPGTIPAAGLKLFAQGANVSKAFRDTTIRLGIKDMESDADHVVATVIQAELNICPARTTAGVTPAPLSATDKTAAGRFIHVQDPGHNAGRAMLIVKRVVPNDWVGTLLVSPVENSNPRVSLFAQEVPAAGQAALANPHRVTHNATFPADGQQLFAEGKRVSGVLRDTGFKLGVLDVDDNVDQVAITVVRLRNLVADVPSTPANTPRANSPTGGNSPVPRHTLTKAGGAIAASDHAESFTTNIPLVLVEDSIQAGDRINLSVVAEPAAVPVKWSVQRDTRPAPDGDHPDIVALSPNALPTLTQNSTNLLRATLLANAVGSFHVRAFVDTNGNGTFEGDNAANVRIDREPNVIINLVLIRVQGFTNASVAQQGNVRLIPAAPTSVSGVGVTTGVFTNPGGAGVHCDGTVDVIGGGGDGLRGLNELFAGWVNNELANATSPTTPPTEDGVATYTDPAPSNATHQRFTVWVQPPAHGQFQLFRPVPPPPPFTIQAGPVLDTTDFGAEGTGGDRCVGTEGAVGPPLAIRKTARPRPAGGGNLGQRWRIRMWDSPGDGAPRLHEGFPAARLTAYRFNIDFRTDLVFWTNITGVPRPTPDAACRLYSSVYSNTWVIRCAMTFNAAGASAIATPLTISMNRDPNTTKKAIPVAGSGLEVRAPISRRLLIIDATR